MLTPSQFGTFGIASLVLAFLEVMLETGVNVLLIQDKKDVGHYLNAAWIISIVRGILIALIIVLLSPLITVFFNAPDSFHLLLLIAIVPFTRGFINPAIVKLQKNLDFRREFWFRTAVFTFDATITVIFAFSTHRAESFVFGLIGGAALEVLLSFLLLKPIPYVSLEFQKMKRIITRGTWVTLSGIFSYIAQEGDNAVVGKMLGTNALGIYHVAYKVATLPISEITDVVSKVVFPVYVKISDDRRRLQRAFMKTSLVISLTAISLGSVIFLFSENIVFILLGTNWIGSTPVIRVLALYGVLRAISGSSSALFLSLGKQEYVAAMTFARVVGLAVTIIPLTRYFGLIGAGYAALVSVLVELPVITYYTLRVFGRSSQKQS